VNDQFGHDTGDRVIIAFVGRVQACIRKRDRIYRLGGEEFVLLLPDTDHSGARVALEKVRDAIQAEPLVDGLRITASIGAAMLEPDDDWPRWLARADSALYQAKDAGRDRVSFDAAPCRPGERRLRLVSGRPLR
jgi:diguanylate cyclase (GGDEF)-like protein